MYIIKITVCYLDNMNTMENTSSLMYLFPYLFNEFSIVQIIHS